MRTATAILIGLFVLYAIGFIDPRRNTIYLGGDIIIALDGKPVGTISDLFEALNDSKPGDRVEIRVMRGNSERTLQVLLSERQY